MFLRRLVLGLSASALVLTSAACTTQDGPDPDDPPTSQPSKKPRKVTFGVYGSADEVEAMRTVVDGFNEASSTRKVSLVTWPDHESALDDVLKGDAPDVFLASNTDLNTMVEADKLRPVDLLLDERGVDFGDRFSRSAVSAFALDNQLQCMAYTVSPMVIYYNSKHVDFDKMEERGLDVPSRKDRWTLAEFGAAAQFASRRGKVRGVWIEPTITALTPFIVSGGGKVFDDDGSPTSLAFSDEDTRNALTETLAILRDPTLTPTAEEMASSSPLEMFKDGKLAMMAGYRHLVPELRDTKGLSFDVIGMPMIEDPATVGDFSGLCISADSNVSADAADFIAYALTDEAVETVTETGYIVPSNSEVAGSDLFLDTTQEPVHAWVFIAGIRSMVVPPFIEQADELTTAVSPMLERLLTEPGTLDIESALAEIDEASLDILSPEDLAGTDDDQEMPADPDEESDSTP